MTSSPTPPTPPLPSPRLPSRKVGAILAALMLAAGIALGALIGPGPADSLASSSRAAALARVLTLLALGGGTDSGSDLLLSSGAAHPPAAASQPTPPSSSEATAGTGGASGTAGGQSGTSSHSSTPSASSPRSSGSTSPTSSTKPAASEGESEKTPKPEPLPPIANVWLVVLPYGGSLENALKQSTAAPYLDGQLLEQGHGAERLLLAGGGAARGSRDAALGSGERERDHDRPAPLQRERRRGSDRPGERRHTDDEHSRDNHWAGSPRERALPVRRTGGPAGGGRVLAGNGGEDPGELPLSGTRADRDHVRARRPGGDVDEYRDGALCEHHRSGGRPGSPTRPAR